MSAAAAERDRKRAYPELPQFLELCEALEDLLKRIADTEDPHVRRIRAKVRAQLLAIQEELGCAARVQVTAARSRRTPR